MNVGHTEYLQDAVSDVHVYFFLLAFSPRPDMRASGHGRGFRFSGADALDDGETRWRRNDAW